MARGEASRSYATATAMVVPMMIGAKMHEMARRERLIIQRRREVGGISGCCLRWFEEVLSMVSK